MGRQAGLITAILVTLALPPVARAGTAGGIRVIDTTALAQNGTVLDTDALASLAPGGSRSATNAGAPAAGLVMQAHAQALRPAPLPDQDLDAPGPDAQALAEQQQASLQPSFYARSRHFAGDGFSSGSTLEDDQNHRHRPGGGMSLSIPVQ